MRVCWHEAYAIGFNREEVIQGSGRENAAGWLPAKHSGIETFF